ncbi:hypothetical protein A3D84_03700 [Candidatus Woesebacteria bacterium RIFCSPHIGHO2_02_FULL_42_20]|uniref:Uncharacterized protein n=1 Tax=Candidatus Woesebacteria bacterium RIFCSPHIGHO2_12_FULL_41_24 TaxID=1802510 RepID=A0A1F8AUS2_9BACT|nr:MAG: hypothetical protein A2W15_03850 [Candidatus Woesebacteria bacterium RBG_16_41_13]OGM29159.1 MAG: hypothetical protein A2873_01465 [Candidatus Woesebacteria bacterium RIFCSPHIGHO2_01_FULL_42_80]OGM35638.1 MAG: hypothetical protein A3D84_03700 [Candidatus Woesebacteria bacterium RIFCSPHIGHO2_02_FULL_42_20]OGM55249.1 MAG: hypothetical protein A3E44_03110 [Candidatus Woesebacteria bacterium RIFCSPHIGHO2_12_FULL_41_24]OGM67203.1 MAG: hypothetical protein A2969_04835 [Candidatus Woesebacteri
MESVQVILVIVVVSLTILFLAVGFQVFLIMLDLRRAVKRLNSLLEDSILGGGLLRPEKLTSILEVFRRKKSPSDTREKGES